MAKRRWVNPSPEIAGFLHKTADQTEALQSVLKLPADCLESLRGPLLAKRDGTGGDELGSYGLLDARGRLTDLGSRLAYHAAEAELQETVYCAGLHPAMNIPAGSRLLDVGCGAGQTLRRLASGLAADVELNGLDCDFEILALGARIACQPEARPIHYWQGSAEALPFDDGSFTHVVCRAVLAYTQQWNALAEMVRVLAPAGMLYLQFEGLGYDLMRFRKARPGKSRRECLLQTLMATLWACAPWQPAPGSKAWLPWRAYTPTWRLGLALRWLSMRVLAWQPTQLVSGLAKSTIVVAQRTSFRSR